MKSPESIILRPMITEKSNSLQETCNQVIFRVARDANKIEIRQAVEKLFGVKVVDVRTMRLPKRWKRVGRNIGQRPSWKKAVVRLREGDKIEFFSGV
ncbi:MAG TPA: 50S ribosomal protein L23 [Myxococcota bacterium]|nr:50S ribosomal protein L23 [Myxococcota bacterium]HRY94429.1 50S ribosomal protein L23 [Myxococcota bacterium]